MIEGDFHPTYEKYEALKTLTLEDFQKFAAEFLQRVKIQGLCQGNLTLDAAINIMENVVSHLRPKPIDEVIFLLLVFNAIKMGGELNCVD